MSERLDVFAEACASNRAAIAVAVVDRLVDRLSEHNAGETAPKPGDADAAVRPARRKRPPRQPARAADTAGRPSSPSIAATGAPIAASASTRWRKAQPRIEALGARMVAIVPDREQFAAEMKTRFRRAAFPILSDMDNGYAMSLNLAIWVGAEMEQYMHRSRPLVAGLSRQRRLDVADSRRHSWWARTAASRRALSILTIASAWRSKS